MTTVACVLRASPEFTREYVVRLYEGVREHWMGDLDFLCLTDTPIRHPEIRETTLRWRWPRYWSKLEFFRPDITGDLLTFDLDTIVCGDLSDIRAVRRHTMLRRLKPGKGHQVASGMMFLPAAVRPVIWREWRRSPSQLRRLYLFGGIHGRPGGDQGFLQQTWERHGLGPRTDPDFDYDEWNREGVARWQDLCPGQIESYKYHVQKRGALGPETRIVCFHGDPRPADIGWKLPARRAA